MFKLACCFLFLNNLAECLKILSVIPCYTGHMNPASGVVRALTARGHTVDVLLGDKCKEKHKSILPGVNQIIESDYMPQMEIRREKGIEAFDFIADLFIKEGLVQSHDAVLKQLNQENYDVIFSDWMLTGAVVAGQSKNVPVVVNMIGPLRLPSEENFKHGTVGRVLYLPETVLPEIALDILDDLISVLYHSKVSGPLFDSAQSLMSAMSKPLGSEENDRMLPISFSIRYAFMLHHGPPEISAGQLSQLEVNDNIYYIGFVPDNTSLPLGKGSVKSFIDKCELPVVYMSFGTFFDESLETLENAVTELDSRSDYCIVWSVKPDQEKHLKTFQKKKSTLLLASKVPQLSILLHEKVKVFITHAGASSMQEAVYAMKPMLTYPGLGDQPMNAHNLGDTGIALPLLNLEYTQVSEKLKKILSKETYQAMLVRLQTFKQTMVGLGGYTKGAEIVEKVAEGHIKFKTDNQSGKDLVAYAVFRQRRLLAAAASSFLAIVSFLYLSYRLCCMGNKPKKD